MTAGPVEAREIPPGAVTAIIAAYRLALEGESPVDMHTVAHSLSQAHGIEPFQVGAILRDAGLPCPDDVERQRMPAAVSEALALLPATQGGVVVELHWRHRRAVAGRHGVDAVRLLWALQAEQERRS